MRRKALKDNLKKELLRHFVNCEIEPDAPQGSNNFSQNVIIKYPTEERLIKIINLKKVFKENKDEVYEEIKSQENLKSPFVIPLLSVKKTSEYIFLEFPFLKGKNLSDYSKDRKFSEKEVKDIGISILRGISDLARHNIVHQDIKPDNIFITENGEVKILDFGSARFKKNSFKGKTKSNRNYSSPEQILGKGATITEEMHLICDEKSDVYAAGIILYQLLTNKLPFESNDEKLKNTLPVLIQRDDVSTEFKEVITSFLNNAPRYRPLASEAVLSLEVGKVVKPTFNRGGFYYSASNSFSRFEKALSFKGNFISGLILSASKTSLNQIKKLKFTKIKKIFDPQLYIFQEKKQVTKNFKATPYYKYCLNGSTIDLNLLKEEKTRNSFVLDVIKYQLSVSPDILLSPGFLIREFTDEAWNLDQETTQEALRIYEEKLIQIPIFKSVIIGQEVLTTTKSRGKMLDYLTSSELKNVSGYFILFESVSEVVTDESWLLSAKEFLIDLLSKGKPVILARAPLSSLVFSYLGVTLGMGENMSQRHFFLSSEEPTQKNKSTHMYCEKLLLRAKTPSSLTGKVFNDIIVCHDECCKHIDFSQKTAVSEGDRGVHFIYTLSKQFNKYSLNKKEIEKDIFNAKEIFTSLQKSSDIMVQKAVKNEFKPASISYLDTWLTVFKQ